MSTEVDASPASFEASYVHTVYSHIASDFSRTRHTRWPFVQDFLSALPAGSVVLDAGCGNGKYLGWRNVLTVERESTGWESGKGKAKASDSIVEERNIVTVGFDMSEGLLGIAAGKGNECVRGDCFDMSCWRRGSFDHAISIATIHHFATPARRLESVKQLILSVLPPFPSSSTSTTSHLATILIVVWALEQDPALAGAGSARKGKKGALPVDASLGGEESADGEQDVFVPWELQAPRVKKVRPPPPTKKTRGGPPVVSPDFSTPSAAPPTAESPSTDPSPPASGPRPPSTTSEPEPSPTPPKPTFNRYYHLFRSGELANLVDQARAALKPALEEKNAGWELEVGCLGEGEWWERENWVVRIGVQWKKKV